MNVVKRIKELKEEKEELLSKIREVDSKLSIAKLHCDHDWVENPFQKYSDICIICDALRDEKGNIE